MIRRKQEGFVLVLTLLILAAITIFAAYFGERVQKSLQLAQQKQNLNDKQINLYNVRAELLFRLGTVHLTQYGLGPKDQAIALDDRSYSVDNTTLQLQDARGLLNLNIVSDERLFRFLGAMEVPADQRNRLIDILRDYIDEDDLRRLNGAESGEYQKLGLPPPTNLPLVSPLELKNVLGWRDTAPLWKNKITVANLTTVGNVFGTNPNTAPWQVLVSLPGITPELAQSIIIRRQLEPDIGEGFITQMTGVNSFQEMGQIVALPADSVRVTQRADGLPWALRYNVQLTPMSNISPWEINYFYRLEEKPDPAITPPGATAADIPKLALPPRPDRLAVPASTASP
ncbi:general secretion pathway protein GspK [Herminiimonas sp. CN]|uniref:general secretion pathway protein GspK n=1 Tax=Herminiimonas sp. CN TaxID=1349818 RepID=UPI0004736352|nr:type II secretion system protein GspK [Herminiimonas sp. CN]